MKNKNTQWSFLCALMIFTACKKVETSNETLTVDKTVIQLRGNTGQLDSIRISTSGAWQIQQSPQGNLILYLNQTSGTGNATIYISAAEVNRTGSRRTGTLQVSLTNNSQANQTIQIIQENSTIKNAWIFGGEFDDAFYDAVSTTDGGFLYVGLSISKTGDLAGLSNRGIFDLLILRTDKDDKVIWKKLIGGSNAERAIKCLAVSDGYLISGHSGSEEGIFFDPLKKSNNGFLMKINENGDVLWNKIFGSSTDDIILDMKMAPDGDIVLCGQTLGKDGDLVNHFLPNEISLPWILKVTQQGNVVWSRSLRSTNGGYARSIEFAEDGNILVTGTINNTGNIYDFEQSRSSWDAFTVKMKSNDGFILWNKLAGGSKEDEGINIIPLKDGGSLTIASSKSTDFDASPNLVNFVEKTLIIKLDKLGNKQWVKEIDESGIRTPLFASRRAPGVFFIGGHILSRNGQNDIWIAEANENGELIKEEVFGGNQNDFARRVVSDKNGIIKVICVLPSNNFPGITHRGDDDAFVVDLEWK